MSVNQENGMIAICAQPVTIRESNQDKSCEFDDGGVVGYPDKRVSSKTNVTIRLLGPLIRYTNYENEFEVEAVSPADALRALTARYPDLGAYLYDDGVIRSFFTLFLDSNLCSHKELDKQICKPRAELCVSVPVAGG